MNFNAMPRFKIVLGLCTILTVSANSSGQAAPATQADAAPPLKLCSHKNHAPCIEKPPAVVHSPDPEYTVAPHNAKIEGTVVLSATIGTDGFARDIKVARPLGYGLDESAIEAVKRWTFKPAKSQGKPVPAKINIEVPFNYH